MSASESAGIFVLMISEGLNKTSFFVDMKSPACHYTHDTEGSDDTPAHLKCSSIGASLSIPITNGRLNLGTWQGIYLCEHRDDGGSRSIVATIAGD